MPADPRKRQFRPPLWATAGTLLLGAAFASLGSWQLDRSAEKAALFARFEQGSATAAAPAPLDDAMLASNRYAVITATGRYDATHQILLDARTRDGRAGYEVLTPLVVEGAAILVNRGWLAANPNRQKLPDIAVSNDVRTVTGLLDALPRAALVAGPMEIRAEMPWPRVMLYPTAADLEQALGYPVRNYQLLLDGGEPEGFNRGWRPVLLSPEEHVGYAVQWFALAGLVVVLYVALNWRRAPEQPPS
jgi:surfeit locus 1 family protein